jgi:3-methyladenine DNA glycosylase AlkD
MTASADRVREALSWLERRGSRSVQVAMLKRYGITAPKAYGVPVGAIQQLGRRLGRDHELAEALWKTGWYEARMLTAYVRIRQARGLCAPGQSSAPRQARRRPVVPAGSAAGRTCRIRRA